MNALDSVALLGELLPIATSLLNTIEKIRTQSPDAWDAVRAQYGDAVSAWENSQQKTQAEMNAQELANAAGTFISSVQDASATDEPQPAAKTDPDPVNGKFHEPGVPHRVGA